MFGLLLGWLAAALVALVPVLSGRWARRAGAEWLSVPLAIQLMLASAFAQLVALEAAGNESSSRHPGVGEGVVTFVVCAIPIVAFYSLGYRIRRDRVLGSVWLAGSIPFTAYAAFAGIALIDNVICNPGCLA